MAVLEQLMARGAHGVAGSNRWRVALRHHSSSNSKGSLMNTFITGATGVLGRTVTRLLIDTGHNVRALARNASSELRIRDAGAEPVHASLIDPSSLQTAVKDCEAILHLATRIPRPADAPRRDAWKENDRI